MICAISQSAAAATSQFTIQCTRNIDGNLQGRGISQQSLRPEIMLNHGDSLRRNFRLRIPGLETGLLSSQDGSQPVPESLRDEAELRGDQLHVPAAALVVDAGELGGADTAGL